MSNSQLERQDGNQHNARLMVIKKNADPEILRPFLEKYQGKFIVIPEDRSAYYIEGPAKVAFQDTLKLRDAEEIARYKRYGSEVAEYDGVSAISWTLVGPSKAYPNTEVTAIGIGRKESCLAGRFHYALESNDAQIVELPEDLAQSARKAIKESQGNGTVLPQEAISPLYTPIRDPIDHIHDEYWKDKLITYEDILLLPQGDTPITARRTWYLQPSTRATEVVDHTLYFTTIEYLAPDGTKQQLRSVEKHVVVHSQEERDQYGTALNSPSEMVRKQQFMRDHGIPTYDWSYTNVSDTKLFVPDLTKGDSEVLDQRVYAVHMYPEQYQTERIIKTGIPSWANEFSGSIDQQTDEVIKKAEAAGMEILKDCLYIVKPKGNLLPRVVVGDLGQGLFLPDDPNKGKNNLRVTL